ncbi:hypothetical protein MKW98_026150 [Papaver atlanticum]|uniref:Uncharacterized protein n=1 Tax=Papaver atlanticum TaxID=357466 RepID=A0AAD4RYK0_9MAGN|nr:hypothetical protein MKW98_026150 [Papaver atlanticum]
MHLAQNRGRKTKGVKMTSGCSDQEVHGRNLKTRPLLSSYTIWVQTGNWFVMLSTVLCSLRLQGAPQIFNGQDSW